MLRLVSYAKNRQHPTKDMSVFKRLFEYGRYILRYKGNLFGRRVLLDNSGGGVGGKGAQHQGIRLSEGAPTNVGERGTSSGSPGLGSTSPFLRRFATQLQSQVRQIFINNVLRKTTTNQEVARKAARRLMYGDQPFFAFVGVALSTGLVVARDSEFDGICWEIRESILRQAKVEKGEDGEAPEREAISSIEDIKFGPIINQGCNAAVYAANYKESEGADWPLAVKMMFNYDIESNAFAILKGMVKEIVPARHVDLKSLCELDRNLFRNVRKCPPHRNIIDVHHAFVDQVPLLEGLQNYPSALPQRLNPEDGYGRNMSLFMIMKRYDSSLQDYLKCNPDLTYRTRLLILTQILSGVAHLEENLIAHRDLKSDNILVDVSQGNQFPTVVISDFGCCLADKSLGLSLPFRTYDTDRGGNPALTAPEISTAQPGTFKYLNYKKSDVWSIGALAYEIFGLPNPFYGKRNKGSTFQSTLSYLDSRTYSEDQLPAINVNTTLQQLIHGLLRRNPDQRISAEKAFNICVLLLYMPTDWMLRTREQYPNDDEILQWLVCLTAKALCQANKQLEFWIMRSFLKKVKFSILKSAVVWIAQSSDA